MRHVLLAALLASLPASVVLPLVSGVRHAAAQPVAHNERAPPAEHPPGEDEALYSCKQHTGQVVVTFKADAEVKDLLAWVMGFTCKNFLLDPRVVATGRKVSMITPNKMTPAEAYRVFLAALSTIGLTVVPHGGVVRVVEAQAAHKESLPLMKQGTPDDIDQVVRYVYKPSYAGVEPLHQAWQAMKSDAGDVFTFGPVLVVTDYGSHVREMLAFARLVDVPGGSDGIYTIPVHHADAGKLTEKINGILNLSATAAAPPRPPGPAAAAPADAARAEAAAVPSKILVDERTNTLLVAGSEASYQRVKALVERLDIALEIEGGSSIHVYPLGSAIAEELAKTLNQAIGEGRGSKSGGGPPATTPAAPPPPPGAAAPPAAPTASLDALGPAIEGQVRVIADPPTNSLIVMSSGRDFLAIKDVIKQLDLPRRQVYIEAMIVEVDLGNDTTLGTVAHGLAGGTKTDGDRTILLGGIEAKDFNSTSILDSLSNATGLFAGVLSPLTVLGQNIPSFAVLFRAVAEQSNANIISSPSIIAVDNVEAKYKVGTTIQVSSGSTFVGVTAGAEGIGNTRVAPEELPLILNIKPHISNDNLVLLEVKHEAKELTGETKLGPTWNTRAFDTRVVVRDQQTVVLGGLSQDKETLESTKVPLLGDVPLLGYLFKTTTRRRHKTSLLVMLTPYIIKDQLDLQAIHDRKLREHDELTRSFDSFARMKYEPRLDYTRKRGLLEEIHRSLVEVDQEVAAREAIVAPRGIEPGRVEPRPVDLPPASPASPASSPSSPSLPLPPLPPSPPSPPSP
ncbi:MAG TPA: type II secretion system secretin GspD [Kofleriaceae bacterium]|nr:type II secretion system secretin GspD [Kofleriaceae bacterium]